MPYVKGANQLISFPMQEPLQRNSICTMVIKIMQVFNILRFNRLLRQKSCLKFLKKITCVVLHLSKNQGRNSILGVVHSRVKKNYPSAVLCLPDVGG